jgi:hypothetical protein
MVLSRKYHHSHRAGTATMAQLWQVLEQQRLSALRLGQRLLRQRSVLVATFGLEAGKMGILWWGGWFHSSQLMFFRFLAIAKTRFIDGIET